MLRRLPILLPVAILLASMTGAIAPESALDREEGREGAEASPADWFGAQRAYPLAVVPQERYRQAVEWARVERAASLAPPEGGTARAASATPMVWQQAGPYNVGGRVTALAVVPGGATVYLGAAAGGVLKSVNSGVNWSVVFDQVTSIGALALDPSNANVIYAGTGEANAAIDNYDGAGLYRSDNAGQSWSYLGLQQTRRIARVKVDPSNPSRIYVAAMGSQFSTGPDRGFYRSENGGQTWSKTLFVSDSTGVCDVAINPAHPETVYCATWERVRRQTYRRVYGPECGIWRSADHGGTWTLLSAGLPVPSDDVGRIALAVSPAWPSRIYAQILGGNNQGLNGLGFYRSDDGGQTWARRDLGTTFVNAFGGFGWYFGDVVADPANQNAVYCLGQNLVASSDGGVNFSTISGTAHVDFHALWIDPANTARAYTGSDGGFFWSNATSPAGASWFKSTDLPITQFYAGTIDPSNASRLLGGAQDNGTTLTTGSPTAWSAIYGGDGFYCLVDPTNPHIVFAESQNLSGGSGPGRSINGGGSFGTPSGFVSSDRYNWCAPFVMAPTNHQLMLAGSHRVYRSLDNGQTYTPISGDLTRNLVSVFSFASSLSTLDIAPTNPNVFYAGTTDGKVWRSLNGGGAWTEITGTLPVRWVTRVTAAPDTSAVVYVTLSGFNQDEYASHVFRSANWGATWTDIDGNLPNIPTNDVLVDPLNTSRLFVANDLGVYVTRNLGGTWSPLGVGLPLAPVHDLTFHAGTRTLVAATHGRSQWKIDLNDLPVAVAPLATPSLALSRPAPDPSRDEVRFELDLPAPGRALAQVYDALGRRVATLLDQRLDSGRHPLTWSGRDARGNPAPPGVYYLRATLDDRAVASRRIVRL